MVGSRSLLWLKQWLVSKTLPGVRVQRPRCRLVEGSDGDPNGWWIAKRSPTQVVVVCVAALRSTLAVGGA
jgi:hypothetical protein